MTTAPTTSSASSSTTRAVLDGADGTLTRLDHTLGTHEAAPAATTDWQPGDPIHEDPRVPCECGCGRTMGRRDVPGVSCVRPMISLLDDDELGAAPRCVPCGVTWAGSDPCWVCGKARSVAVRLPVFTWQPPLDVAEAAQRIRASLEAQPPIHSIEHLERIARGEYDAQQRQVRGRYELSFFNPRLEGTTGA